MLIQDLRLQFIRGTTAENDAYTGREGELTLDYEKKMLRIHDGVTPGGTESIDMSNYYTKSEVDTSLGNVYTKGEMDAIITTVEETASGGTSALTIQVESWSGDNIIVPTGVTVTKEYDNSSLRITHNRNKYPTGWFAFNKESAPMTGILPTSLRNIQIVNTNEVIVTSLSSFEQLELSISF